MAEIKNTNIMPVNEGKGGFTAYLSGEAVKRQINATLGGDNGQRFCAALISTVSATAGLKECNNASIVAGALLGESLKLSPLPTLGQYYLVPFGGKAQFVLGYKGMIQLAARSGQYLKINVVAIKQGELVKYDALNEEIEVNLIQDEEARENAPTIGYYAMFEYVNGFKKTLYWSRAKMEKHAERYSAGYKAKKGYTFWEKDFDEMAKKTMLRQIISKWGVMSVDLQTAYMADGATIKEDLTPEFIEIEENAPAEVVAEEPPKDITAKEIRKTAKAAANATDDLF